VGLLTSSFTHYSLLFPPYYNVTVFEKQGLRSRAVGLLIIAGIILLLALIRWGNTIPWSAR
jgi:predicted acyltransferase